ncbi:MAG: hypothetical protein ABIR47_11245 [Candidatus Kapaibacterium sp.]
MKLMEVGDAVQTRTPPADSAGGDEHLHNPRPVDEIARNITVDEASKTQIDL